MLRVGNSGPCAHKISFLTFQFMVGASQVYQAQENHKKSAAANPPRWYQIDHIPSSGQRWRKSSWQKAVHNESKWKKLHLHFA